MRLTRMSPTRPESAVLRPWRLPGKIAVLLALLMPASPLLAQTDLGVAVYTENQELQRPGNLDEWIHMGTAMGGDYKEEPFDPANPGTLGVVLMEPAAYRYFKQYGEYADGTMFLLSFYASAAKSDPQLQGFVQGALRAQEIHVIDSTRFSEGRGFFLFDNPQQTSSSKLADGNDCVRCHTEEGGYGGTFIQFYPTIRDLPRH